MRTAVSWYRSAQARYLIARHDAGGITLTEHERLILLELALAGRERRDIPAAYIARLRRLIKNKAPAQLRRRPPHAGIAPTNSAPADQADAGRPPRSIPPEQPP